MILRNLAHITHLIYFLTGTAAGTLKLIERPRTNSSLASLPGLQPGCYYPFPFLSISEAKTQVQPHKTRFIAYHYSSLLIITQFITHHYSNSITHHYAPLHYLGWVKILLCCLKISCHKTMHTQPLRMKIEGGAAPPSSFVLNDE